MGIELLLGMLPNFIVAVVISIFDAAAHIVVPFITADCFGHSNYLSLTKRSRHSKKNQKKLTIKTTSPFPIRTLDFGIKGERNRYKMPMTINKLNEDES